MSIIQYYRQIITVINQRGIFEFITLSIKKILCVLQNTFTYEKTITKKSIIEGEEFDAQYEIDTERIVSVGTMDIKNKNWKYSKRYQPIPVSNFNKLLEPLKINFSEFVFIDVGSGKGRALLLASHFPFKKIIGIEFSKSLTAIAELNLSKYPSENKSCKNIELICLDALDYELPDEKLVLFLYNPFHKVVMEKFVKKVSESFLKSPRKIYAIYVNPIYTSSWFSNTIFNKIIEKNNVHFYETIIL